MDARARPRRLIGLALVVGASVGLGVACLIPDSKIQVLSTDINLFPVRFVEAIPLTMEARCSCSATACECPMPAFTGLPPFLDPADPGYQFCSCGENREDTGRLPGISFFVEDQDQDVDGEATDQIYAVALLDWDPSLGDTASDYIAYTNYLDPRQPLDLFFSSYETLVLKRPRPYVRSMTFNLDGFDLCNGAGRTLAPGFHTLTIMATDRPWFTREGTAVGTGDSGADSSADPLEGGLVTLEGVPDIAAGATYDMQSYVFRCFEEGDVECGCVDIDEP